MGLEGIAACQEPGYKAWRLIHQARGTQYSASGGFNDEFV